MSQSFNIILHLNERVIFGTDPAVPEDLQGQAFTVIRTNTLILNDFYFNNEVFTSYELKDEQGKTLFLTPFRFEEDAHDKLRITKALTPQEIQILFPQGDPSAIFKKSTHADEAKTIVIETSLVPASLKNWLGRSYYIDLKDQGASTASYIDYDLKNKKNINAASLLSKHASQQYTLFQGDYALYFLEANFDLNYSLMATLFLDESNLERNPTT